MYMDKFVIHYNLFSVKYFFLYNFKRSKIQNHRLNNLYDLTVPKHDETGNKEYSKW